MLHLFHGDNHTASRKELSLLKEKFIGNEVLVYNGKIISETDLVQITQSNSLFTSKRLIIIENLISKQFPKKSKELENIFTILENRQEAYDIVLWEEKEISKTIVGLLPENSDIAFFQLDRTLFTFVESLVPGKSRDALSLFNRCLKKDPPELVFSMLVRQIRFLIQAKEKGSKIADLTSWQAAKFKGQSEHFTLEKLLELYKQLFTIDVTIKSGISPFNLEQHIQLFIMMI